MVDPNHTRLSIVRQCRLVSIARSSFYYESTGENPLTQGSQFTSVDFTDVLTEAGIRISMDGKGRWMDNVFIERLWRSLKYECVYLSEFATGSEARSGISWWMDFYNERRPHSALDDRTPQEAYTDGEVARSPGLRPVSRQPKVA